MSKYQQGRYELRAFPDLRYIASAPNPVALQTYAEEMGGSFCIEQVRDPADPRPVFGSSQLLTFPRPAPSINAVLHVPPHKQTRPSAAPAQIVDTEWHALARIAA